MLPSTTSALLAPSPSPTSQRTGQLPTSAVALSALATQAAAVWASSGLPALRWLSPADFIALAATYAQGLEAAEATRDQRGPQARRLRELDRLVAKGLKYVKGYLAEAHDTDEGRSYYPEFGIGREGRNYVLATARAERVKALSKLLLALQVHDFDQKKYGTAYWQPLAQEYAQLVQASTTTAGQRSGKVSQKDQHETQVRKALRALVHHLKANYPDTFAAKLREFGFQKESY